VIVAKKKSIEEIIETVKDYDKILIAGCNECVTVCEAGGKREVAVLASALRMYFMNQGKEMKIDEGFRPPHVFYESGKRDEDR
jgi:ferredoxin